ncbi:tyrosine-type recombinase/integrase [Mycobacteroides abscessus]|uniref:tyrosine-type recombinase/integrase n=1 Tax=Mycobacteroides abscessus TaxID=36809 RepID=UPI000926EFE1|nr:site-specific integrase [Mycobacteroides abscessus]SIC06120.1 prophage integrase [Mycobacteroides abscessus subsp. bolletii]SKS56320.1 prophage integrase [Mycobacteroides abscessus subsp. bolletii]
MAITKYISKSGPRWRVEWRLPDRTKRRKIFRTEREAKAFEAEVISSRSRGVVVDPRRGASITVEYAYTRWLASRQDFSAKVRRGYEDCWRISVQPMFGPWPLAKVDRHSIQEWVNAMTVGPRTRRWRHSVLRMTLQYAVEQDWLVKNPSTATTFPPMPAHDHTYLTADEVERLAALCGPQGDIVLILAYTGLRWGELTGLRVADINLTTRRLQVRRSITQVGGKLILGATKSRAGVRTVPIPTLIEPLLTRRVRGKAPNAAAITSPRGALLSRENWVRSVRWNEQRKRLGKPQLRIHDLRHTYASLSRFAGADLRLLQRTLGHASITVTAHTYAHLYDTELDSLADALDSLTTSASGDGSSSSDQNDGPPEAHQEHELSTETELD